MVCQKNLNWSKIKEVGEYIENYIQNGFVEDDAQKSQFYDQNFYA